MFDRAAGGACLLQRATGEQRQRRREALLSLPNPLPSPFAATGLKFLLSAFACGAGLVFCFGIQISEINKQKLIFLANHENS
jgi:hypothetical protein